jgi:DNA-binding HxlR family transcriptional regulator
MTARIARARALRRHKAWTGPGCPVEATLALIDGKWKGVLLHHLLAEGTLRFGELSRRAAASPRVLTRALRELEADQLVRRTVHATVPPRVDYAVTPLGESLRPVIAALRDWGDGLLQDRAA